MKNLLLSLLAVFIINIANAQWQQNPKDKNLKLDKTDFEKDIFLIDKNKINYFNDKYTNFFKKI